ncbi:MAG TPA: hypothetical protein VHO25_16650 [Polyangiaceae bacterium]|nr:hypothetical protein [Polyangiaceae bacterium]
MIRNSNCSVSSRRALGVCAGVLGVLAVALLPDTASAQSVIKNPTAHPKYIAELEPHLLLDIFGEDDFGLGGRATFVIVDPGFITTINNSVGISFGLDWMDGDDHCHGGGAGRYCHDRDRVSLPAVMQWNFWFTPQWSAFGEPGLVLRYHDDDDFYHGDDHFDIDPALYVGGRFNFNDSIALTLRIGSPAFSFGASFFL